MRVQHKIIDELLEEELPATRLVESDGLTLYLLAEHHSFIGKFILELLDYIPIKNVTLSHFSIDIVENNLLFATIKFEEKMLGLKLHLEGIIHELEWGVKSPYHAARMLEMKVLSMDKKKGLIRDHILDVVHRFPSFFDYDLFSEMQQFFLNVSEGYFRPRSVREVVQTLTALYLMRKKTLYLHEIHRNRRHVGVKVMRRKLNFPLEEKEALEIVIGINVLKENEVFNKSHLLKAIQNIVPEAELIIGSDYLEKKKEDSFHLLTLEVEKEGGFSQEDITDLKQWLPRTLKGKIEHLQRCLFMPRNEEEILRHIITLGKELHFSRDLPQLILSFEKQTETDLIFTVILARILLPETLPIEEIFSISKLNPKIDRVKQLGILRKKYPKEAVVFKVELPISPFLREDQSIDLYKGRESILKELKEIFGEIRDYNGGMISKQNEVLQRLEKVLGEIGESHHLLLENFFHSLSPLEKRSFIDPQILKTFFLLLLEKIRSPKPYLIKEDKYIFIVGEKETLDPLKVISNPLITLDLEHEERFYVGFIGNFEKIQDLGL